jgi:hypothetical protein
VLRLLPAEELTRLSQAQAAAHFQGDEHG